MQSAFERESQKIDRRAVLAGARHLQLPIPAGVQGTSPAMIAAAAGIVVALVAGGWWFLSRDAVPAAPQSAVTTTPSAPPQTAASASTPTPASAQANEPTPATPAAATTTPSGATATGTAPAAPSSATPSSSTPSSSVPSSSATTAPAARSPEPRTPSPAAAPQFFEITVASFRTVQRADQVADDLAAGGIPVSTKADGGGEWYRVIAGPYPTRAEAEAARTQLTDKGFTGTRITTATPAP
jgi:cell division protein FtsN